MSRTLDTPVKHAIVRNEMAKDDLFKAQDAVDLIEDYGVRTQVAECLWSARSQMEHADRILRDALARGSR